MFRKLNIQFNEDVIKKCLYLTNKINTFTLLDHNKLEDYVFFDYEDGSEEKDFCEKFEKQSKQKTIGKGLQYDHKIIDFPYKKIIDHLPKQLIQFEKPSVRWQVFGANSFIPAHIDADRLCSINFYLSVSNEKTVFYNNKRSGFKFKLKNGNIVNESFLEEWLDETGSFVANMYDIYLLNSSKPHSVMNTTNKDRISLQFSFKKINFEMVSALCLEN